MGEAVMIKTWLIQFVVYIVVLIFCLGMSWAAYGARIAKIEENVEIYSKDHDTLVALNTKVDLILKIVYELQEDLKEQMKIKK